MTDQPTEDTAGPGHARSRAEVGVGEGCVYNPSRRTFLSDLSALAAGAVLARRASASHAADSESVAPYRIDVHCHFAPPSWVAEWSPKGSMWPPLAKWTPAKHLEDMDQAGVAVSIVSITTPGLWFGDAATSRRLARECNDYAARLAQDYPRRFRMFVALPFPDVEDSLREIEYGLDSLHADGIGLFTSYGDKWLGDPAFAPVFEELNRRRALVYTHPAAATCCHNLVPGISDVVIEYGTDTSRAIARMVFGGSARRYPQMRVIFSHAGGTMPFLVERFDNFSKTPPYSSDLPEGFRAEARKFYYDTAQTSNPAAMAALKAVIPTSHVVFGTDYPFRTHADHAKGLRECGVFSDAELRGIERENILALLPRRPE